MNSQGTCHVNFHILMPLIYLGHQLAVVPVKAFSLNGVLGRETYVVKKHASPVGQEQHGRAHPWSQSCSGSACPAIPPALSFSV